MKLGRYRITSPTFAVYREDDRPVVRMVPVGAFITVDFFDGDNLLHVTWDGKEVLMYPQDLQSRCEPVH